MSLHDPFLAFDTTSAFDFVQAVRALAASTDADFKLNLDYNSSKRPEKNPAFCSYTNIRNLTAELEKNGIRVAPPNSFLKTHDRWVNIELRTSTGERQTWNYGITSGLSNYMRQDKDCLVVGILQKTLSPVRT